MTDFVSVTGFSPNRVTRPIAGYGLSAGDRVTLVSPEQNDSGAAEQTQNAIQNIEQILTSMAGSVTITTEKLSPETFMLTVDELSRIVMSADSPVICLGAGASDLSFPLAYTAFLHAAHISGVAMFSDLTNDAVVFSLPNVMDSPPARTDDVFLALARYRGGDPPNNRELAAQLDISESTVSRYVGDLEDYGLVEKIVDEQERKIQLTPLGCIIARQRIENQHC